MILQVLSLEGQWPFWGDYGLHGAQQLLFYFQVGNFIPKTQWKMVWYHWASSGPRHLGISRLHVAGSSLLLGIYMASYMAQSQTYGYHTVNNADLGGFEPPEMCASCQRHQRQRPTHKATGPVEFQRGRYNHWLCAYPGPLRHQQYQRARSLGKGNGPSWLLVTAHHQSPASVLGACITGGTHRI